MKRLSILLSLVLFVPFSTQAFTNGTYAVGAGFYSQNFLNETAQDRAGKTKLMGAPSYPLIVKYDFSIGDSWFLAPQFSHTFFPRETEGDSAEVTLTHLAFLFGKNFEMGGKSWDWHVGSGILQQQIKGKGGTVTLLNGSTPTVFYLPNRTVTTRKVSLNVGTSYTLFGIRTGLELIIENALSSTKRSQSFMFTLMYPFNGGPGGGSKPKRRM